MKHRKRVLMIGKYFYPEHGGIEQHMLDHFRELKDDIEFTLLVFNKGKKVVEEEFEGARLIRVPATVNIGSIPIGLRMWKFIREYNGDIILIHAPNPTPMMIHLFSKLNKRVIVMHHYDITRQKILLFFYKPFLNRALKKANTIIATAENNIKYSTIIGKYKDKCKVIPLGIDTSKFVPTKDTLEKALLIKKEYPGKRVLFVGRFTYYKGLKYLIDASENCEYHLLIIGSGHDETQLRKLSSNNKNIHILTGIENLLEYYYSADLFVLPSIAKSEAFGIVQLEAMICGLPVITTDLPSGVPEVQVDGETGIVIEPKNPTILREKIDYLLNNDVVRMQMGKAASARVRDIYTIEKTKERYLNLYYE
jgi:rhamnosyl/mannosyltransferase